MFKYLSNIFAPLLVVRYREIYDDCKKIHYLSYVAPSRQVGINLSLLCGVFPFFVGVNPYAVLCCPVGAKGKAL